MTERDCWTEYLRCPACGRTGEATLSQDGPSTYLRDQRTQVDHTPPGFRAQARPSTYLVDFYCVACNIIA